MLEPLEPYPECLYHRGDFRVTSDADGFASDFRKLVQLWRLVDPLQSRTAELRPLILAVAGATRQALLLRSSFSAVEEPALKFLAIAEAAAEAQVLEQFSTSKKEVVTFLATLEEFLNSMSHRHLVMRDHSERLFRILAVEDFLDDRLGAFEFDFIDVYLDLSPTELESLKDVLYLRDRYLRLGAPELFESYLRYLRDFSRSSGFDEILAAADELEVEMLWMDNSR